MIGKDSDRDMGDGGDWYLWPFRQHARMFAVEHEPCSGSVNCMHGIEATADDNWRSPKVPAKGQALTVADMH
jgi:hypothetical protein